MSDLAPVPIANPAQTPANPASNRSKKRQANQERKAPYPKRKTQAGAGGADVGAGVQVQGVSKLKAAIRQTTRLLARESLDPALRISTERRLTSLQRDLAQAQTKTVEKEFGKKYHMVKFFDRKKLLRLITRTQRLISQSAFPISSSAQGEASTSTTKEVAQTQTKEELEAELWQARVMLNYVDQYPNTQKYISLFPTTTSGSTNAPEADDDDQDQDQDPDEPNARPLLLPPHLSTHSVSSSALAEGKGKNKAPSKPDAETNLDLDKSSSRRLAILLRVEELMRSGELNSEPEVGKERKVGVLVDIMPVKTKGVTTSVATSTSKTKTVVATTSGKKSKIVDEKDGRDPIVESNSGSGSGSGSEEVDGKGAEAGDKGEAEDGIEDDFFE